MAFEKYVKVGSLADNKLATISVYKGGRVGISTVAVQEFGLADYKYASLLFDEESSQIGICFTMEPEEDASSYVLKFHPSMSISATAFLRHFNIKCESVWRATCCMNKQDPNLLVVTVPEKYRLAH